MPFLATGWLQLSKIKKFLNIHTNSVISKIKRKQMNDKVDISNTKLSVSEIAFHKKVINTLEPTF